MARARRKDETFEDYREAVKAENLVSEVIAGGRWVWNSSKHGTYRRPDKVKRLSWKARDKGGAHA